MVIDLRKTVIKRNLRSFFFAIIFTLSITLILLTNVYSIKPLGIDKYVLAIMLAASYLFYIVYNFLRAYNYIYFSDAGDKIILRYFSMSVFVSSKNSIEIPKQEFSGYGIQPSLMGLREKLFLYQHSKRGVAKYPGVCTTALSREERSRLLHSLDRWGQRIEE